ncbi:anti-adapter protein IraM [Enterobacter hormaechei]
MEWITREGIFNPDTGTRFIVIESLKKLRLIIWYDGDFSIPTDAVLVPTDFGVVVNGVIRNIKIIHIFTYNSELLSLLRSRSNCPGDTFPR